MDKELVYISTVKDGSIVMFPNSAYYFMKICNPYTGIGGVVELFHGAYLTYDDLEKRELGVYCRVYYDNLDKLFRKDEEE